MSPPSRRTAKRETAADNTLRKSSCCRPSEPSNTHTWLLRPSAWTRSPPQSPVGCRMLRSHRLDLYSE